VEDLGGIAILILIWVVGAVFDQKKKQERKRRQAKAGQKKPTPVVVEPVVMEDPVRVRVSERRDATQQEGSKLEEVLRQFDPDLAEALGKAHRPARREKPRAHPPKTDRPTPTPVVMPTPIAPELDFMAKAEAAVARRRKVADGRVAGRTAADHAEFHDAIRKPVITAKQVVRFPKARIREAVVWREILGPPKAFTLDED
jgi:hypothetical protein